MDQSRLVNSRRNSKKRLLLPLMFCALAGVCWFLASFTNMFSSEDGPQRFTEKSTADSGRPFQPPTQFGFVGSAACSECHPGIAESYASHPMALSMRGMEENQWLKNENQPVALPGNQKLLTVSYDDGILTHHEQMFDRDGVLIYDQSYPMKYVIGSGSRAKAYLRQVGDLLFMSPLNWYSQSESWDLAPNYLPDDIRRFNRRVKDECLGCHAGRVIVELRNSNRFPDPVFHEMHIGCERCHGPGEKHIEYQKQTDKTDGLTDPIINPAKLDYARQESVCYECHLSASTRVLRPGRTQLDFRPGMELSDIWVILDEGTQIGADGHTKFVNHVQQMRDSRCFSGSGGVLGCISCHNPHRVPEPGAHIEYYREKCLSCHDEQGCSLPQAQRNLKSDDCAGCHMPSLRTSNITHVAQTDHRILRKPTTTAETASQSQAKRLEFFDDLTSKLSAEERQRALAAGTYIHHKQKGFPLPSGLQRELEEALKHFPDDAMLLTMLGNLAREQQNYAAARSYLIRACEVSEAHEEALDGLIEVYYETADWRKVVECATELTEIDPTDTGTYAMLGDALMHLGQVQAGIDAVERATELNPGALPLHEWLLVQYRRQGLNDLAEEKQKLIERIGSAQIPERLKQVTPAP